ncbi:hypothetical protein GBN23_06140 [Plesiomonas shigelloides]|uniref:hypothetical protein n=1 Tax=Plesiomonas shigelloides TaxID=703 RepID=UPI0012616419|nr:hypothetical protein [Plesiomonas shigelloides]KAB7681375.1 hypothetical protein GBN23_06140 [Plesiomonas shigelloides]
MGQETPQEGTKPSSNKVTPALLDSIKQAVRHSRGESATQPQDQTSQLSYINDSDPSLAREHAKTEDLRTDTQLKKIFAVTLLIVLGIQLLLMNIIFALIGAKVLEFENFVINLFMGGTLAEVFGIVLIMTRYLFSKHN